MQDLEYLWLLQKQFNRKHSMEHSDKRLPRHLLIPQEISRGRRLPFYLALEEWVARELPDDDWYFSWRVRPTVIFGRNQQIFAEVDLEYCREHGIAFYRRRSGGGCVYADLDNIMISYVTSARGSVAEVFSGYSERLASILRELGLDAAASGRNDVSIGGRKVSGGAFYRLGGRSILHSTMLYSTDMENMLRAITPSRSKLESKQVASVEARLTTVSEHLPGITVEQLDEFVISRMGSGECRMLTAAEAREVEAIERNYYTPEWIYGARRHGRNAGRRRIDGVGELAVYVSLAPDGITVEDISIDGDYFLLHDLDEGLLSHLRGTAFTREAFRAALEGTDVGATIANLDADTLIDTIFMNVSPDKIS